MMTAELKLPGSVCIDGIDYAVNTDFKNWIMIARVLSDTSIGTVEKITSMLKRAYAKKLPPTFEQAMQGISEFYAAGEKSGKAKKDMPVLDFYEDFNMIASAFLHDYGIDIWEENLHWWKFRALFDCLGEENKIIKVIGYRATNLNDIENKSRRKFYKKMKEIYRLSDRRSDEEREMCLTDKLCALFEEV